jgi:hypothetical protein
MEDNEQCQCLSIGSFDIFFNSDRSRNIIYAGTGVPISLTVFNQSGSDNSFVMNPLAGKGILVSTNDGQSWTLKTGITSRHIYKVLIIPGDSRKVLVAGNMGLEVTNDSGDTWQPFLSAATGTNAFSNDISDMVFDPRDPNVLFICINNGGLYRVTFNPEGTLNALGNYNVAEITFPVRQLAS